MKKRLLLGLLLAAGVSSYAQTTWKVGPTETYKSPNAIYKADQTGKFLQPGDIIEVAEGEYKGDAAVAAWQVDGLTIKGMGSGITLNARGKNAWGKGIFVVTADADVTFENITFTGATVGDKNGAGIRLDPNANLTVNNCVFHNNENGILGGSGSSVIKITNSSFYENGYGDGFSHNIYIGGNAASFTFEGNYSGDCNIGHLIKSRAEVNIIRYNLLVDKDDSTTSRTIDLPQGGLCIVVGNSIHQGVDTGNKDMIAVALENRNNAKQELYMVNNSMHNGRVSGGGAHFVNIDDNFSYAMVANNIFAGPSAAYVFGFADVYTNNLEVKQADIGTLMWKDIDDRNYELKDGSIAIDAGQDGLTTGTIDLTPKFFFTAVEGDYENKPGMSARTKNGASIDAGAFEHGNEANLSVIEESSSLVSIYPNPVSDVLNVQLEGLNADEIASLTVVNTLGSVVASSTSSSVNIASLASGIYILTVELNDGTVYSGKKIIKE